MLNNKTIYLVDGPALCYRSFYAMNLSTSTGLPSSAVYGFYQTLKKLILTYQPEYMAICFDVSRKTFRQEKYKEYKIQRPPLPDNLKTQLPWIKETIEALAIPILEKEGFEADDLIATVTKQAQSQGMRVVIITADKDMYQLLADSQVIVYNLNKEALFTKDDFIKEYGFEPKYIVDYLALLGDSSDNIPGAEGIGKVGASKLIQEFNTVENMFNNLDKISAKTKEKLVSSRDSIMLSKDLVLLSYPDLDLVWQEFKLKQADQEKLAQIFRKLEFKNLLKDLTLANKEVKVPLKDGDKEYLPKLKGEDIFISSDQDKGYLYCPKNNCIYVYSLEDLTDILKDQQTRKISYDFKKEMIYLWQGLWFDVMLAAYVVNSSLNDYSLSNLLSVYLEEFVSDIAQEMKPYYIYRLYEILNKRLEADGLAKLFFEIEMPLIPILWQMQYYGIKINKDILVKLLKEVDLKILEARKEIFNLAGKEFNLNSPQQLKQILFFDLKIKPSKKTKTGYSTAEEVLEKIALEYPIAEHILTYRQLNKLKTTYITPLIEQVEKEQGLLHASFNQAVTGTGRLSSSSPNLQSIPVKGDLAVFLRRGFVSSFEQGYILAGDYSQIELRILAHCCNDENLIEAFNKGLDIHTVTAALLFSIPEKEVTAQQRNIAKRVNFGILYGISAYGLSRELKISIEQAENFIIDYFNRYPKVKEYIENIYQELASRGFVSTIMGRRRYLPDFNSPDLRLKEFAQRQAVNSPIQGTCADLIKLAMIKIYAQFKDKGLKTRFILQIHDELVFDVPQEELPIVIPIIKDNMQNSIEFKVPITVQLKYGRNWADMKEI